jgi:membrane-associated phospholipid phosphatase
MDVSIYRWFNRLADHTAWAHWFFHRASDVCIGLSALLLVGAAIEGRQRGRATQVAASVWAAMSVLVALGIGQLVGGIFGRARPYAVISGVHVLVDRTTDVSFPSDHATIAGAVAVGLLLTGRRWGLLATAVAVLMAFTRVYVGAHYLSDVVAGVVLGAIVAVLGHLLLVPSLTRLVEWLSSTRLARVVVAHPKAIHPLP